MIIDLDSHLREGYFMDEVYNLPEPYARFTPQRMATAETTTPSGFILSIQEIPRGTPRTAILISTTRR